MPSLGSHDHVEDAVDSLHRSGFQYIVLTGTHTNNSRLDSCLDRERREMLLAWVREGHFEQMLMDHFERNPLPES